MIKNKSKITCETTTWVIAANGKKLKIENSEIEIYTKLEEKALLYDNIAFDKVNIFVGTFYSDTKEVTKLSEIQDEKGKFQFNYNKTTLSNKNTFNDGSSSTKKENKNIILPLAIAGSSIVVLVGRVIFFKEKKHN